MTRTSILCQNPSCFYKITGVKIVQLLKLTYLSDTMFPSSAGKLRILLEDRSRYTRLWSLAMSEGIRDKELSLRCKAVKWVSVHNDELKLLTFPVEGRWRKKNKNPLIVDYINPKKFRTVHENLNCCQGHLDCFSPNPYLNFEHLSFSSPIQNRHLLTDHVFNN